MKNILVIGGSYFLGKSFLETMLREGFRTPGQNDAAAGKEAGEKEEGGICLYVLNRGSVPVEQLFAGDAFSAGGASVKLQQLVADRHDGQALGRIAREHFAGKTIDAVVDFCGYEAGEIEGVFRAFSDASAEPSPKIGQYLLISTVDVYRRGTGLLLDETAELEERNFGGEAGAYIAGKVALERELVNCCGQTGTVWTSLRPSVIYGPGNYAPREGMYFHWIREAGQILHPSDATGFFQPVYVGDVARALRLCIGRREAYNRAYNVCNEEALTYERFADILVVATGVNFTRVELSVQELTDRGIALPFPFYREESERYSGLRVKELGLTYTDVTEGMRETFLKNKE